MGVCVYKTDFFFFFFKKDLSSKRIVRLIDNENVTVKGWQEWSPSVDCKIWDAYALHIAHPIKRDVGGDISNPSH